MLCSGSTFNGNYSENLFNFKNYQLNFAEVMVDGVSVPSQAITPNYTNGDFSEAYWTLMCEEPRIRSVYRNERISQWLLHIHI